VPELERRGRVPLVDGRAEAVQRLAKEALKTLPDVRSHLGIPKTARPALLEGWQTRALLIQIAKDPLRVAEGRVGLSEFGKRFRLMRASL